MTCEHTHKDAPENSMCEDCLEEYRHNMRDAQWDALGELGDY